MYMWNGLEYEEGLTAIRELSTDDERAVAEIEHVTEHLRNGDHYFNIVEADDSNQYDIHAVGIAVADGDVNRGYVFSQEDTGDNTFSTLTFEYQEDNRSAHSLRDGIMRCTETDTGVTSPHDLPNNLDTVHARADVYYSLLSTAKNGKASEDIQHLLDGYQPLY